MSQKTWEISKNMGDFSRNVGGKRKILAQNHNFVREFTFIIVLFLRLFPNKTQKERRTVLNLQVQSVKFSFERWQFPHRLVYSELLLSSKLPNGTKKNVFVDMSDQTITRNIGCRSQFLTIEVLLHISSIADTFFSKSLNLNSG